MGGLVGAVVGFMVFFTWIRPRDRWLHADVIIFGYPIAQFFGRLGCFSVHDHVGEQTNFFLGVTFRAGQLKGDLAGGSVRHDLGLYEALICLMVAIIFLVVARVPRKAGYFVAVWCILYGPLRFALDFMRKSDLDQRYNDARYLGLTPGQYVTLGIVSVGVYLILKKRVFEPIPAESSSLG
jgi:phosphatidylglycerol:prolipoprotein diacylglycerol transferase